MAIIPKNVTPASRELNQVDVGNPAKADPGAMGLVQKLQDPNARDLLVKAVGQDLVDKLDKIFNPRTMPGAAQDNAIRDMIDQMRARMKGQQA